MYMYIHKAESKETEPEKVGGSDSRVNFHWNFSLPQTKVADEWLSQAIPLPRSPRAGTNPKVGRVFQFDGCG